MGKFLSTEGVHNAPADMKISFKQGTRVAIPVLTEDEIAVLDPNNYPGFVVINSTTSALEVWINGARLTAAANT